MKNTLLNFILLSIISIFSSITKESSLILQIHKYRNTERNFSQQKINKIYKCTFAFHSFKIKFLLKMRKVLNLVPSSASTNSDYPRVHAHLYNKLNNWCSTQYKYITPLPSIPNVTMITNEAKKKSLIVVPRQFLVNT